MVGSGLFLSLALSIDGFIVGLHYGLRRIVLPFRSRLILAGCTGGGMALSMLFGELVLVVLPLKSTSMLGGGLLIALGVWQLLQALADYVRARVEDLPAGTHSLMRVRIRPLGIVVDILTDPTHVDQDASGVIDTREALLLGVALGLDTLGAGFAAAMIGFGWPLVVGVTASLLLLLWAGLLAGRRWGRRLLGRRGMFVPGAILVLMGTLQF